MSDHPETSSQPLNSVEAPVEPARPEPSHPHVPLPPPNPSKNQLRSLPTPHADKFRVAFAALVGVAVGAIIIAVLAASGSSPKRVSSNWSAWAPDTTGNTAVQEIADFVSPFYRESGSEQLNVVTPIALAQETAAGTTTGSGLTVAFSNGSSTSSQSLSVLPGKTIGYNICGLGPSDCELPGTPSSARLLLLRREALELILYTLKYIPSAQNVLVVLPPGHTVSQGASTTTTSSVPTTTTSSSSASSTGTKVTETIAFTRSELQPWLNVPLDRTLQATPPEVPDLPTWMKSEEAALVDQLTGHGLFNSQVESQQVGGKLLVLTAVPPQ